MIRKFSFPQHLHLPKLDSTLLSVAKATLAGERSAVQESYLFTQLQPEVALLIPVTTFKHSFLISTWSWTFVTTPVKSSCVSYSMKIVLPSESCTVMSQISTVPDVWPCSSARWVGWSFSEQKSFRVAVLVHMCHGVEVVWGTVSLTFSLSLDGAKNPYWNKVCQISAVHQL